MLLDAEAIMLHGKLGKKIDYQKAFDGHGLPQIMTACTCSGEPPFFVETIWNIIKNGFHFFSTNHLLVKAFSRRR